MANRQGTTTSQKIILQFCYNTIPFYFCIDFASFFFSVSDRDILKCQSMVQACVHPTTNQIIPFYGRMSSFVPVNIPICAGTVQREHGVSTFTTYVLVVISIPSFDYLIATRNVVCATNASEFNWVAVDQSNL